MIMTEPEKAKWDIVKFKPKDCEAFGNDDFRFGTGN